MAAQLNLQRNTKVFISTVDLASGAAATSVVPANTWQVEILAGYAVSQAAATQDITSLESGTSPDRSQQRFNTALNPVDWNFQAYLKPTGMNKTSGSTGKHASGNSMPVADWFMWQAMMSNLTWASGTSLRSNWQDDGKFALVERVDASNTFPHSANFSTASEYHLYFQMDNVIYQVANATINQGSIDAAIDGIATTTWTGFGTNLIELRNQPRNNAVSVFGGVLNSGSSITANSNVIIPFIIDFDPQNWIISNQFRPTVSGYYVITVNVWWQAGTTTGYQTNTKIIKNGSLYMAIYQSDSQSLTGYFEGGTKMIYMNGTTDYIYFTVTTTNTSGGIIQQGNAQGAGSYFTATLITSGTSGQGGSNFQTNALTAGIITTTGINYRPAVMNNGYNDTSSAYLNFGNPPYSANSYTDGAGYGNFSYAVPSGYYALNTKNLAEFG